MSRKYPLTRENVDERDYRYALGGLDLPDKVDLRKSCPKVFDQGKLGSCTANVGATAYMMLKKNSTELSRLYLYYEARRLEGTTGKDVGATMRSIGKALNKVGICTEKLWPYIEKNFAVDPPSKADADARNRKITAYRKLSSQSEIKQYIAKMHLPVLIGMDVYESFEKLPKDGFVSIPDTKKESLLGGHAVLVVGYDDNLKRNKSTNMLEKFLTIFTHSTDKTESNMGYFIVRNSWGTDWGDKGYCYLPYAFMEKYAYDFWIIE